MQLLTTGQLIRNVSDNHVVKMTEANLAFPTNATGPGTLLSFTHNKDSRREFLNNIRKKVREKVVSSC